MEYNENVHTPGMIQCYKLAQHLKWGVLGNLILSSVFAMLYNYYFLLTLVGGIVGYSGAKNYKKTQVLGYIIYILLIALCRVLSLTDEKIYPKLTEDRIYWIITMAIISSFFDIWLLAISCKLLHNLRKIPVLNLQRLKILGPPREETNTGF